MAAYYLDDPFSYIDPTTAANLRRIKTEYQDKDYDYMALIVADKTGVGLGKSTLETIMCACVDLENNGKDGRRFTPNHIFFESHGFRMAESRMQQTDSFGFDEPDVFFSQDAGSKKQKTMKLKITHIRQQRYFMVLCSPSIFLVAKWFRPGGETRINLVIRIVKRGVFYVYSGNTGTMDKIQVDERKHKIIWPACDYIGFFKPISKSLPFWKEYFKNKQRYLHKTDDNVTTIRMIEREERKLNSTLTLSDIAEIHKVHKTTVQKWYKALFFGKRGAFKDVDGTIRVKMKAYKSGIARIRQAKERIGKHGKYRVKRGPYHTKNNRKLAGRARLKARHKARKRR